MAVPQPDVGNWYRMSGGDLFEVVAFDHEDGTIEIQYFDGSVEELDLEDWQSQWEEGEIEAAQAPEDWTGPVDVEPDETGFRSDPSEGERDLRASGLDNIDLFE